jgi:hypothetical protein
MRSYAIVGFATAFGFLGFPQTAAQMTCPSGYDAAQGLTQPDEQCHGAQAPGKQPKQNGSWDYTYKYDYCQWETGALHFDFASTVVCCQKFEPVGQTGFTTKHLAHPCLRVVNLPGPPVPPH